MQVDSDEITRYLEAMSPEKHQEAMKVKAASRYFPKMMGRSSMRIRHLLILWLLLFLASWVVYLTYNGQGSQICRGQQVKSYICENYKKGIIGGPMCQELCQESRLHLSRCLSKEPENQIYEGTLRTDADTEWPKSVLIKYHMDLANTGYKKPEVGSSMDDFRIMITAYLNRKLGEGSYEQLQMKIVNIADINHDGKVSLPEARSMWALLQGAEFLIMMVLPNSEYIPKLLGFCGDLYVTEGLTSYRLYGVDFPSFIEFLFPKSLKTTINKAASPDWPQKAHIGVGLLEFVEEIFDGPTGNLLMCDVNELSVGYNGNFDVKVINLASIYSEKSVTNILQDRQCRTAGDCTYGANCRSYCDSDTGHCSGEMVRPNLQRVCEMLYEFLLRSAPSAISIQLQKDLDKCVGLEKTSSNMLMDRSLILNELKDLLWKQISNSKQFMVMQQKKP